VVCVCHDAGPVEKQLCGLATGMLNVTLYWSGLQ
jgi:hypothetical protein